MSLLFVHDHKCPRIAVGRFDRSTSTSSRCKAAASRAVRSARHANRLLSCRSRRSWCNRSRSRSVTRIKQYPWLGCRNSCGRLLRRRSRLAPPPCPAASSPGRLPRASCWTSGGTVRRRRPHDALPRLGIFALLLLTFDGCFPLPFCKGFCYPPALFFLTVIVLQRQPGHAVRCSSNLRRRFSAQHFDLWLEFILQRHSLGL